MSHEVMNIQTETFGVRAKNHWLVQTEDQPVFICHNRPTTSYFKQVRQDAST